MRQAIKDTSPTSQELGNLYYPRCAACGYEPSYKGRVCPECGDDAIVRDAAEHAAYDTARLRDEGKHR